jgi:hypothetical protein
MTVGVVCTIFPGGVSGRRILSVHDRHGTPSGPRNTGWQAHTWQDDQ